MLLCSLVITCWCCSNKDNPLNISAPSIVDISITSNNFLPAEKKLLSARLCGDFHIAKSGTPENPTSEFDFTFLEMNESREHTFENVGTFPYYCKNHREIGKIIVE